MYHYTSLNAFDQIIKNKTLRMTRAEFLNDPEECNIFFDVVGEYYNKLNIESIVNTRLNLVNYNTKTKVKRIIKDYPITKYLSDLKNNINFYILSFTSNNDELSMWNYYGDNGIMIKINKVNLLDCLFEYLTSQRPDINHYIAFADVKYWNNSSTDILNGINFQNVCDINTQSDNPLLSHIIDKIEGDQLIKFLDEFAISYIYILYELVKENLRGTISLTHDKYFQHIYNQFKTLKEGYEYRALMNLYMFMLSAFFKPESFHYEKEFRIVYVTDEINNPIEEEYELYKGFYKPFISFHLGDNLSTCIDSITLSPMFKNFPIDYTKHLQVVKSFTEQQLNKMINVSISKHCVRW